MDLKKLQKEQSQWADKNFKGRIWQDPFMGLVEEVGELSHALLKQKQSIRGSYEDHEREALDAVGDVVIYLMALYHLRGWDLEACIKEAWEDVSQRDWTSEKASK